jgi:hypothetical protein
MLSIVRTLLLTLPCVLFLSASLSWADTLTARVDRTSISLEQTLTLQITYDGRSHDEPDLTALGQNFDILARSHSSSFSMGNGGASSSTRWNLTLAPKMAGQLLIPPLSLEGSQSKPITITVTEQSAAASGDQRDMFVETSVDKTTAYVQEQILLTYRFYYATQVSGLEPKLFQLDQVQLKELPITDYSSTIGHRNYNVKEFKIAVTVDKSGDITLPSTIWNATAADPTGMMGMRGRQDIHRLKTDEIHLKIKPKPTNYPANTPWLPAKSLTIEQEWSRNKDQLTQGEPVTRTLTVNATGVSAEQLPPIGENLSINGLKIYPDKPQMDTQTGADGLTATRIDSLSVVPSQSGTLEIPAIDITWWDTQADQLRTSSLPAQPISIAAAADATQPANSANSVPSLPEAVTSSSPQAAPAGIPTWLYGLLGLLLISNGITLTLLLRKHTPANKAKTEPALKPKDLWAQITHACQQQNPKAARDAVVHWFQLETQHPFTNLTEIAQWADDPVLTEALTALDTALYSSASQHWQTQALLDALLSFREKNKTKHSSQDELAPLY